MSSHQSTPTSPKVVDQIRTDDGGIPTLTEERGLVLSRVEDQVEMVVTCSFKELPVSPTEWDAAVERLGSGIYMTYDWLRTWWHFYAGKDRLRLFVFRQAGQIVGLLPIYLARVGLWPLRLVVARLVGANIPPKVFDPPLDPGCAQTCMRLAVRHLVGVDACGLVSLGPVSEEYRPFQEAAACWEEPYAGIALRRRSGGVHSVFQLPARIVDYMNSLGKSEQKNRRKYELRFLSREHPVRVEVLSEPDSQLKAAFEEFAVLHTRQWQEEGMPGHFAAWPDGLEYNRSLVHALAPLRRVRLLRIWAGDQVVAGQYVFAWGKRWFWELPARAIGPPWDRFSLGPTGVVVMIGEAVKQGMKRIEGGLGHYDYKVRLKAIEHPVWVYRFRAPGLGSMLKRASAAVLQTALRLGYHKLWYRRIQPRLPGAFRRPQWRLWVRHDY
jgi:CelD/BcsL family acetyltransferase involved in cellulose biosynthesis